jgi:LysM repeat protein
VTPPKDSFWIRLPAGAADSFPAALAALPKTERVGLSTTESKKGATIESIAWKSGISETQLSLYNPKLKRLRSGRLVAGQQILVPSAAVAAAARFVPDPSIERYRSSRRTALHVVRSGETLSGIAKQYGTTTAVLMRANGLRRALIFPGQSLVVTSAKGRRSAPRRMISAKKRKRETPTKGTAH